MLIADPTLTQSLHVLDPIVLRPYSRSAVSQSIILLALTPQRLRHILPYHLVNYIDLERVI